MQISLLRADITSMKVDGIVSDSNRKSRNGRPPEPGGGNLLARFVIHAPIPDAGDADADAKLRGAILSALEQAEDLAIASLGVPLLAKGAHGFTTEDCARIMVSAALAHQRRARSLQKVVFCLFGREDHEVFERILGELQT